MIGMNQYKRKWKVIQKDCPVCGNSFETKSGHPREKVTCSYSCSNTFFAKKRNVPERYSNYRTICFKNWERKCMICGFDKIVEVHHRDYNNKNNNKENLIPLCPNHHQMLHTKQYGEEIVKLMDELIKNRGVA